MTFCHTKQTWCNTSQHYLSVHVSRREYPDKGQLLNTLRPTQNGGHFAYDIFKWIFLNGNFWFPIKISLKFVPTGLINNIPALVQIMAWRRPGDKPLSEPMMVILSMHICVTRPQWVKTNSVLRDHSGYGLSRWEATLHCNMVSHWLRPYPEWYLGPLEVTR